MRRSFSVVALSISLFPAGGLRAQNPLDRIAVRTFPLQGLSPKDAADLIAPYTMMVPGAGVFEAGGALRAITVRGTSEILTRVDSILRANDHPRTTLVMRFQLIAASDSGVHDAAIGAVDAELRNLFRFAGYRLLSQGTAMANESESFTLTMAGVNGEILRLSGHVISAQPSGGKGSAHLSISLERPEPTNMAGVRSPAPQTLLSSSLTVPLGETVVLGSAAYGAPIPAIILAVRPDVTRRP
ncbi:MAG TPA: hypothetical protein VHE78_07555 [Gemmatimonadaceae bacterium]|nr:hypothetical protein [Gemmatimonadaceae bacterium]